VGEAVTSPVRASAPARLDFAGGWTDVPPYSTREGGVVVAAAVQLYSHAEVCAIESGFHLVSEDLGSELRLADATELSSTDGLELLRAGLRMLGHGPCRLTTRSDVPPGSGLGSSGALDVALVMALSSARGERPTLREIAGRACYLEGVEAGVPGGRQDQFTAAFGGMLRLEFHDPTAEVERLELDPDILAELERRVLLCYTGASRFSGATIERVMSAYQRGEHGIGGALDGLRKVADRMAEALRAGDLARVGALLTENWVYQQTLDPGMRTSEMARLERAMMEAGALGGKAAGAGAGGCMFFLAPDDPGPTIEAARALGMRMLPVRWAHQGVREC
jgi:D-glycero-alpha-D-manno-heptose-7-phosphate kinase